MMFKDILGFLLGQGFQVSREELRRQNRLAIGYFAHAGIPVALANVIVQAVIQGVPLMTGKNWVLPAYFLLVLALDRLSVQRRFENSTALVYALEAPVMIISILLGTAWDPTHQAMTFLMFMSVIPIFILDTPVRVISVQAFWNILFCITVVLTKGDPAIVSADLAHALEFYLLSVAVSIIVLRLRFEVVYNLDRANYHLEHDVLTDTQNRLCLEARIPGYAGRPVFVCMASIDHLSLLNDFYGKQTGDEVIGSFAHVLKGVFGETNSYRLGGDEFLAVAEGVGEDEGLALMEQVRSELSKAHFERLSVQVTVSFGYVWGEAPDAKGVSDMVQLANIFVHAAHRQVDGAMVGSAFDEQTLRDAIAQSNIDGDAQAHEVNQLTGLPSLPYFVVHAQETLNHLVDLERHPVIGYLNVANFTAFNDKYGYEKGDELIQTMARLIQEALPHRHVTYVSGSKFALMCYLDEVRPAMYLMRDELQVLMGDDSLHLRAGFAEYHQGEPVISLVDKARMAHKSVGPETGRCWRIYDEDLDDQVKLSRYLVAHLDQAMEEGWLKVYYQPIMWGDADRIANLEALSRWDDPTYGMLAPYKFIGVLERENLIYKLSLHVVRQALADIRRLAERGLPIIPVSVNLSRTDFLACDMVTEIANLVEEAGLEPWVLSIEITESAFTESQELLEREVKRFHEKGFAVWMDDFGSEYSTLNLLEQLDFDLVKLDMRFMRNFTNSGRNAIIVSAVVEMCARLGMETLVEGVEEMQQRDILREMGTGKLQGYLYSRPLPLDEVADLIIERGWAPGIVSR